MEKKERKSELEKLLVLFLGHCCRSGASVEDLEVIKATIRLLDHYPFSKNDYM